MKRKIYNSLFLVIVLLSTACDYHYISFEEVKSEEEVFFAKQIEPIFQNKCLGCHTASKPVLSDGNAWNNLTHGNYINLGKPEESILYVKTSGGHPGGNNTLSPSELGLILSWVEQGAKDN